MMTKVDWSLSNDKKQKQKPQLGKFRGFVLVTFSLTCLAFARRQQSLSQRMSAEALMIIADIDPKTSLVAYWVVDVLQEAFRGNV